MNLTIKNKLYLNAGLVAIIISILMLATYFATHTLGNMQSFVVSNSEEAIMTTNAAHIGTVLSEVIGSAEINRDLATSASEWAKSKKESLKLMEEIKKNSDTPEEKQLYSNANKALSELIELYEGKLLPLLKQSSDITPAIRAVDHEIDTRTRVISANLEKFAEIIAKETKASDEDYDKVSYRTQSQTIVMGIAAIIIATLLSFWIIRSIAAPLQKVLATLTSVSGGDLTVHCDVETKDEMGLLAQEVNSMCKKLGKIINQVAQNSTQVASAATQLYSTSEQMATGAEEVANQAGTVATAGEEMTATSTEIAQNCTMAFQGSQQANDAAVSGAAVVQESVAVMNRIAERVKTSAKTVESLGARSDQIGEIVGTIEDIADQTNLLALNAAIEAARAGEQGRGFAVVADEVRALAERTTKATKEIGQMIKAIQQETKGAVHAMDEGVHEVEKGTSEAARSGEALKAILIQINSVTAQVSQIATAAEEQTATTTEISNNIQQITEVVQETAKGAQESATAASQLARLAEELQRLVGQFKLAV